MARVAVGIVHLVVLLEALVEVRDGGVVFEEEAGVAEFERVEREPRLGEALDLFVEVVEAERRREAGRKRVAVVRVGRGVVRVGGLVPLLAEEVAHHAAVGDVERVGEDLVAVRRIPVVEEAHAVAVRFVLVEHLGELSVVGHHVAGEVAVRLVAVFAERPGEFLAEADAALGAVVEERVRIDVRLFGLVVDDRELVRGEQVRAPLVGVAGLEAEAVVAREVLPVVRVVEKRNAEEARHDAPAGHVVARADARAVGADAPVEAAGLVRAGGERGVADHVRLVGGRRHEKAAVFGEHAERRRVEVDPVSAPRLLAEVHGQLVALPERAVRADERDVAGRLRVSGGGVVADAVGAQLPALVADRDVAVERRPVRFGTGLGETVLGRIGHHVRLGVPVPERLRDGTEGVGFRRGENRKRGAKKRARGEKAFHGGEV